MQSIAVTYVALLRGINVGGASKVVMADLRALVGDLGYSNVRTVLNSGNVVFAATGTDSAEAGSKIEEALAARLGVGARVITLTSAELATIAADNPLLDLATNPSRLLVAFLARASDRRLLEPLLEVDWSPEALAVGTKASYLWCPEGMVASKVAQAVGRELGDGVTTRSWSTVTKILALTTA